jgi:hypothetical protein
MQFVSWDKRFVDPIAVPGRKPLVTLRDAATYITKLPQGRTRCRRMAGRYGGVAELDGPPMFARIGIMRALNRGHVREFNSSRKDTHWGQRKLKRAL